MILNASGCLDALTAPEVAHIDGGLRRLCVEGPVLTSHGRGLTPVVSERDAA
jgi:hypothetical protein